jgi:hypothetical protein
MGVLALYFIVVPRPSEKTPSSPRVTTVRPPNITSNLQASVVRHARFDGVRLLDNRLYQLGSKQAPEMPEARPFSTDLIDQRYKPDFDPGLSR